MFERFTQADTSITRQYGGTGLGLAICHQLVEIMGGTLTVSSLEGHGSSFVVKLVLPLVSLQDDESCKDVLQGVSMLYFRTPSASADLIEQWLDSHEVSYQVCSSLAELLALRRRHQHFNALLVDTTVAEAVYLKNQLTPDLLEGISHKILVCPYSQQNEAKENLSDDFSHILYRPLSYSHLHSVLRQVDSTSSQNSADSTLIGPCLYEQSRVLLVEDNPTNLVVAQQMLDRLGIRTSVAGNGQEAIDMLEDTHFDLVLMDCQMPVMDGYQATRLIRGNNSEVLDHKIPIVAMTAHALAGDKEKCLAAGMNDYMTKPITLDRVEEVLKCWLKGLHMDNQDGDEVCREDKLDVTVTYSPETSPPGIKGLASEESIPAFDREHLASLLMNDPALIKQVIKTFLNDIPGSMERMHTALDRNEWLKVGQYAHKVKGAAANVGGMQLNKLAYELETASKLDQPDREVLMTLLSDIESSFWVLASALEEKLKEIDTCKS